MADFVTRRREGVTRRLRLKGYDYRQPGYYFLTVTLNEGKCLFGEVRDGEFSASEAGHMAIQEWASIAQRFPSVVQDHYCVMPNHFHAIVGLGINRPDNDGPSLSNVIQAYKSRTTLLYGRGVRERGWVAFSGKLWHTGFHDHIICHEAELDRIREYIESNPARWNEDRYFML
jgi:putative transposase